MSLLRRRGIGAGGAGVTPVPVEQDAAYFQTDQNIGVAPSDQDLPGYFQTDQNIEE